MTMTANIARRIAAMLVDRAARWLPARRSEWGDAMREELRHVKSDRHALEWALGCVFASFIERVHAMNDSQLGVSRWVAVLEWLVCFGPLTLLWVASVWVIGTGVETSRETVAAMLIGTLGPVALVAALAGTISSKAFPQRWLIKSLLTGFLVLGVLQLLEMFRTLRVHWFDFDWSLIVLLAVLPLLGCLHLLYASRLPSSAHKEEGS
jgi:hypothetical protein